MDITPFIRELLFGHDCVIIPRFGGFIGNYTPAHIDKSSGLFYPPLKQISFNRNLSHNDGLLIGRVSESLKLNYADARNIVELFSDDLKVRLSKGEKVVFQHIGSFQNNHEGNVQFEPDRESNFNLNSYGLAPFTVTPLEGFDVRKRILPYEGKGRDRKHELRKYLWRAAVIIPLLGAMVAVPFTTRLFKSKVETTNLNPLASVEFENNREAVRENKSEIVSQPGTVTVKKDSEGTMPSENVSKVPSPSKDSYCVIAGSFRSQANAQSLMKKLTGEGYTPELMPAPNGFYRVSALKCTDAEIALQKKDSISKKYSGSWITKIN
ncbi:MAG TPA: SPOR domain-containing protein [Bacteroidales bacterium]|nr:SPOR domain-containing protein [Bacteroidales bacterium]